MQEREFASNDQATKNQEQPEGLNQKTGKQNSNEYLQTFAC